MKYTPSRNDIVNEYLGNLNELKEPCSGLRFRTPYLTPFDQAGGDLPTQGGGGCLWGWVHVHGVREADGGVDFWMAGVVGSHVRGWE